jgi:hypothetical protein
MDVDAVGMSHYINEEEKQLHVQKLEHLLESWATPASAHNERRSTNDDSDSGYNKSSQTCLQELKSCARNPEGLVNNEMRKKIWPILLGLDDDLGHHRNGNSHSKLTSQSTGFLLDNLDCIDLPPHKDECQVQLDIQRSHTILNHIHSLHTLQSESYTTIFSKSDIDDLKKHSSNLIIKMLRKYPQLNYYQGYHDIASVILLVSNVPSQTLQISEELAFKLLESFTVKHLRDFMITDIQLSVNHLRLIPTLLENIDQTLFEIIRQTSLSYATTNGTLYDYNFFPPLSSILTWYSHDISSLQQILQIWDFSLSYDSVLANVYIYVAALLFYKDLILNNLSILSIEDMNNDFTNVDKDILHSMVSPANLFSKMTDKELSIILAKAKELIDKYPIENLENGLSTYDLWFKKYNKHSVLETTSMMTPETFKQSNNQLIEAKNSIKSIIPIQDGEVLNQTTDEAILLQKIIEQQQQEEATDSTDLDSTGNLLSSSLSLTSSTSTLNNKLANTSSMILKKLFKTESWKFHDSPQEVQPNEITSRTKKNSLFLTNIYRISFTIGFFGFLIHFLLIRNNETASHFNVFRYLNVSPLKRLGLSILDIESLNTINVQLSTLSRMIVNDFSVVFQNVQNTVQDTGIVHKGIALGTIGLANVRNTIYGLSANI